MLHYKLTFWSQVLFFLKFCIVIPCTKQGIPLVVDLLGLRDFITLYTGKCVYKMIEKGEGWTAP